MIIENNPLRRVRRLWNSELVPAEINRANQRKWIQAVRQLGSKWVLANENEVAGARRTR